VDLIRLFENPWIPAAGLGALFILVLFLFLRYRSRPERVLKRQAQEAIRRGNLREAARIYHSLGDPSKALELYLKGGFYLDAAQIMLATGKKDRAALLYEKAGRYLDAARLYEEIRQFEEAVRLYEKAGNLTRSAEILESLGKAEEAGRLYEQVGLLDQAVALYEKRKRWDLLAPALYKLFQERKSLLRHPDLTERKRKEIQSLGLKAIEVLKKTGRIEEAVEVAEVLEEPVLGAQIYEESGMVDKAVELLVKHHRLEEAAELLEKTGNKKEADLYRARFFEESGDHRRAGAIYEAMGELEKAKEQYHFAGDLLGCARVAEALNQWEEAAQYYFRARDLERAGLLLEKAQAWEKAAQVYHRLGKTEKVIELLLRSGRFYEAALHARQSRFLEKMVEILERVPPSHPDYRNAQALLAEHYQKTGALLKAVEAYEKALKGEEIQTGNLPAFYELGVLLEKLNRGKEAVQIWEKILKFDPHYRDVRERRDRYREAVPKDRSPTPSPTSSKKVRYAIMEEIGRGGMGIVYKALDRLLDRVVALKILPPSVKENPGAVDNFIRTTKRASALIHPNIVVIFDAGQQDQSYYIAMEYLSGKDLREILNESGPFPLPFLLLVAGQIAKGLGYAHSRKVLHLDIKPSNILWIPEEKQVKITDFGLSHAIQEVANYQTVVGGTPNYMSPEQIIGDSLGPPSDIYSLGVMMYELATGRLPFAGMKGDVGYHHVHTAPPPPRKFRSDLPEALEEIIMKCLAKEPQQRFASMEELFQALQKLHKTLQ